MKNLPYVIRATDILTAYERKHANPDKVVAEVCIKAQMHGSEISYEERNTIFNEWVVMAKAGKLVGVRTGKRCQWEKWQEGL